MSQNWRPENSGDRPSHLVTESSPRPTASPPDAPSQAATRTRTDSTNDDPWPPLASLKDFCPKTKLKFATVSDLALKSYHAHRVPRPSPHRPVLSPIPLASPEPRQVRALNAQLPHSSAYLNPPSQDLSRHPNLPLSITSTHRHRSELSSSKWRKKRSIGVAGVRELL